MRILLLLLKLALFLLVLTFAVRNTESVTVRYLPGWEWQSPLIFVLLVAFCIGVVLGLLAVLPRILRQRREIAALRREREAGDKEAPARDVPAPHRSARIEG